MVVGVIGFGKERVVTNYDCMALLHWQVCSGWEGGIIYAIFVVNDNLFWGILSNINVGRSWGITRWLESAVVIN